MAGSSSTPDPRGKVRLVVLYGGRSAEHEVSCVSAFHVLRAADPARYDVRLVGITTGGRWVDAGQALAGLTPGQASLPSPDTLVGLPPAKPSPLAPGAVGTTGAASGPAGDPARRGAEEGVLDLVGAGGGDEPVVVFPLLHGPNGEDGTVQGLLEVWGVPYVGAGVAGSASAMDKGVAKAILASAGVPQVRHLVLRDSELEEQTAKEVEAELGWPVFVKPANLGSSIGISQARDAAELAAALELAARYDEWVVIEERVEAREIEVGVLGSGPTMRASVPGEIIPSREFYDFEDKYLAGKAVSRIPADLPPEVAAEARRLSIQACRALRIDGMARVDWFFEHPGRGLLLNEVNTIPGFTPISQYPQLWAASGVDYPTLVDELVRLGVERHARRARFDARRQLP